MRRHIREEMPNRATRLRGADSRWSWLYKISGAAALLAGVLLLVGMINLIITVLQPGTINGWLSSFEDNWLIVIFRVHAGFSGAQVGLLHGLDFLDTVILALVGTMYLGLYAALKRTSRIWSIIAAIQPFLGIVLFVATKTAGRSGVMGAGLVISLVMLWSRTFDKATACIGILASVLLLAGDFSAGVISPSIVVTTFFGVGYVLLTTWFFLVAQRLFRLGWGVLKEGAQQSVGQWPV
jgi:hypothetical protein